MGCSCVQGADNLTGILVDIGAYFDPAPTLTLRRAGEAAERADALPTQDEACDTCYDTWDMRV